MRNGGKRKMRKKDENKGQQNQMDQKEAQWIMVEMDIQWDYKKDTILHHLQIL